MCSDDIGVAGWIKSSFIDFPGTIATVLFFRNCNLRCPYCHNPGIVLGQLPPLSASVIWDHFHKRAGVIEGVVLTGGEPALHATLPETVERIRSFGLKVKLDSNGLLPAMITRCNPDYLALDIKCSPAHYALLGWHGHQVDENLRRSIEIAESMRERAEIRITVAPSIIDEQEIRELSGLLKGVSKIFLQPMQHDVAMLDPSFSAQPKVPFDLIECYRALLETPTRVCRIRGV